MKRFISAASLGLAVLVVLAIAGSVAAGEKVTFKGHLEAVETHTPLAPPFVMIDVDATGKATHVGKFTLDIEAILNFKTKAARWNYDVYADKAGKYRWRALSSNGQNVGSGGESFSSKASAQGAADNVKTKAGGATGP